MNPLSSLSERWSEIDALLDQALALPAAERRQRLAALDGERQPAEIALAALLLACEDSAFCLGSELVVDGCMSTL